jgi:hypothetical protein
MREEVQLAAADVPQPPPEQEDRAFSDCAIKLITRWEVSGVSTYNRKWQGVVWPGGSSGPTWGIGYDGGHQTTLDIVRDWKAHPSRTQLKTASGVIGVAAKQRLGEWGAVRTPYPYAAEVFATASLPAYRDSARRALGPNFDTLPVGAQCALVSMGYNRGWQMTGERRRELRTIRDECMKDNDVRCIAEQIRASKRLWPDSRGLRDRRDDEARVALT